MFMKKYLATIKVSGKVMNTAVFADSAVHARLLLQYQYGMDCLQTIPRPANPQQLSSLALENPSIVHPGKPKTIKAIKPLKPQSPEQMRISNLKAIVDRQKDALRREKDNQRRQREAEHRWRNLGGI